MVQIYLSTLHRIRNITSHPIEIDRYILCDDQVVEDVGEQENTTSYIQLCPVKFEHYLLSSMFLTVPTVPDLY